MKHTGSKVSKGEVNQPTKNLRKLNQPKSDDQSSQVSQQSKKSLGKGKKKLHVSEDSVLMSDEELLKMYDAKSTKEQEINSKEKTPKKHQP